MRCWVEYESRNSISSNNHVLFCLSYKHNSHYWQGNSTSLMNESKGMDNPHLKIVKCDGTKAQDEKN